ncbi:MAG TPA: hypothetical protein VLI93_08500 [Acetobacteraceae bacterium]|nr:hypothetical protein [Acetobacteraceae bacterium]
MATTLLNRQSLQQALNELGQRVFAEGKTVEIALYGGSALMLTFDWRVAPRDVDAVFEADRETVRRLATIIAEERGWDRDWLNDWVKGFLSASDAGSKKLFGTYPSEDQPGLRVMLACPRYLYAMKCRAMRIAGVEGGSDVDDVRQLAKEIGITDADQALELVAQFYPNHLIAPKTRFGLQEILAAPLPGPEVTEQ